MCPRYSRLADWDYIERCAANCLSMPVIGNGDVVSFEDWNDRMRSGQLATGMIARGALIKPWIFAEVRAFCQTVWQPHRMQYEPSFWLSTVQKFVCGDHVPA